MATETWIRTQTFHCPHLDAEAHIYERRVYPNDPIPSLQGPRILARRCSLAIECNLAEVPCRYAFTNPDLDPLNLL